MNAAPVSRGRGSGYLASAAIALAVIGVGLWVVFAARPQLGRSATGIDGLAIWLSASGMDARSYDGPPAFRPHAVGLRILPLYDANLTRTDLPFSSEEELLGSGTEFDIAAGVVRKKLSNQKTLLIAPKWTRAARHSGYAHASLLAPVDGINDSLRAVWGNFPLLRRPEDKFLELRTTAGRGAALYAPQLFVSELAARCQSVIGGKEGHLLIRCLMGRTEFLAVSDPDFLNNHGLSLGDNAVLARDFVRNEAGRRPVVIDLSADPITVPPAAPVRHKSWADLARFFAWPFTMIWLGFLALLIVAVWRGGVRFGPPARIFDDRIGASKDVSIRAKANLLRLAGKDAEVLRAHVANRIRLAAGDLLGPAAGQRDPAKAVLQLLRRRDAAGAAAFSDAFDAARFAPGAASPADLLSRLERFETQLEKVMHEFGRTAQPG